MYKKQHSQANLKHMHLILKHHRMTKSNMNEYIEYIEGSKQSIVIKPKIKKILLGIHNTLWLDLVAVAKLYLTFYGV